MGEEKCEGCRFWDHQPNHPIVQTAPGSKLGECRRGLRHVLRLPNVESADPDYEMEMPDAHGWPVHYADDWCGEYQPRTPLPVVPPPG